MEVAIHGCTSRIDTCESKGVSQAEDRSGGVNVKRLFEALALFSPFDRMTTYLGNGHEEGRCMMCLCIPFDRADPPWLMPCS